MKVMAEYVRQQFTQPCPGLAVLAELEKRAGHGERALPGRHAGDALAAPDGIRQLTALQLAHVGLVIEQVHLRGSARLVQEDHTLGLGCEMRQIRETARLRTGVHSGGKAVRVQQRGQRRRAEADAVARKEVAARHRQSMFVPQVHATLFYRV